MKKVTMGWELAIAICGGLVIGHAVTAENVRMKEVAPLEIKLKTIETQLAAANKLLDGRGTQYSSIELIDDDGTVVQETMDLGTSLINVMTNPGQSLRITYNDGTTFDVCYCGPSLADFPILVGPDGKAYHGGEEE